MELAATPGVINRVESRNLDLQAAGFTSRNRYKER